MQHVRPQVFHAPKRSSHEEKAITFRRSVSKVVANATTWRCPNAYDPTIMLWCHRPAKIVGWHAIMVGNDTIGWKQS